MCSGLGLGVARDIAALGVAAFIGCGILCLRGAAVLDAVVKMFCAYCRRTLRNARTDIIRKQAREARWETVFSDMHESELNRLASPDDLISEEVVFEVVGREVVVMDTVLADAIHGLSKGDQAIVLLYYFAEWTDRRIAEELGCPRSTVQFRRSKALLALRARLEEVIGDDEL